MKRPPAAGCVTAAGAVCQDGPGIVGPSHSLGSRIGPSAQGSRGLSGGERLQRKRSLSSGGAWRDRCSRQRPSHRPHRAGLARPFAPIHPLKNLDPTPDRSRGLRQRFPIRVAEAPSVNPRAIVRAMAMNW
jgi:hypothetical protein